MKNNPLVTVICATYNHESYIKDALDGFVKQETNFEFQVLVGDDGSTDNTPSIVLEYAEQYPNIIIPVLRKSNIGAGKNWVDLISRANSPYIAFCDGDDYWHDKSKLQKQFDYMEQSPDLRACFHDALISIETEDGTWFQSNDYNNTDDGRLLWPSGNKRFRPKSFYRIENFIPFGFVHTSSMFIRWDRSIPFPDWFFGKGMSDYPLWVLQIGNGRFGYIPECLSTHRRTNSGAYDFESKAEFWAETKPGWVELDKCFIDYFKSTVPSKSIERAFKLRMRDDLSKLIKGALDQESGEHAWRMMVKFSRDIKSLTGISIKGSYSETKLSRKVKALQTAMPLPPYNSNRISKLLRRFFRRSERKFLGMK